MRVVVRSAHESQTHDWCQSARSAPNHEPPCPFPIGRGFCEQGASPQRGLALGVHGSTIWCTHLVGSLRAQMDCSRGSRHRGSMNVFGPAALCAATLALGMSARPLGAATIEVPPLTVTQLTHNYAYSPPD